jgi:predicted nucleic acid-binding protein
MSDAPAAGRPPDPPTCIAFLDASVLYPATLRNLLMHLAVAGVFRPLWTNKVQDEWTAALLRDRPDLDAARLAHRRTLMDAYIYDARVIGYEPLIDGLVLPDPDDRHVLAGAIHGGATVIVTTNLRDFPAATLGAHGIEAQHPDAFVRALIEDHAEEVTAAVAEHRAALVNPPKRPDEYLAMLERHHMTETVAALRSFMNKL